MKKRLTMFLAALFLCMGTAMAQTKVSGTVFSQEDGQPIIGAAVKVDGTSTGMLTDVNGRFSLTLPAGKNTITVSYLGYESKTLQAKNGMRVFLKSDATSLDEVVVTAMGISRQQKTLGYSAQTLDDAELTTGKLTDVVRWLVFRSTPHLATQVRPAALSSVVSALSTVTTSRCMLSTECPSRLQHSARWVTSRQWVVCQASTRTISSR